jgi:ferritin-like metal-binding protein YciE
METAHELFIHELNDILDGEKRLVEALSEQEQDSSRPELKKAFAAHRAQTEKQIERLQQVFRDIGEEPEGTECHGIKGLIEEKKAFQEEEDPSEELIDIFNVGAAVKVESYEIHSYQSLIRLAQLMGHRKAAQLLNQNLKEEQQTLKKMEDLSKKLKPSELGMGEEEEEAAPARGRSGRRGRRAA